MALRVLSAILFSPRGGSAHVARAQARELRRRGVELTLLSGSRSGHGDARRFYGEVVAVDYDPALASPEPLRYEGPPGTAPIHPSFEDRPEAPDAVFASLNDLDHERQVRAWARELERAGAASFDVALVHHLTPLNEAMARVAPGVPVVGQLHGTELLMLERIEAGPAPGWRHATRWAERLRGWAQRCEALLVTPTGIERAAHLLGVRRDRLIPLSSGVDVEVFSPIQVDRSRFWHEVLVTHPEGWLPGLEPGSARYHGADVARLADAVVLLSIGRFTAVKRLDRLIAAYMEAACRTERTTALVLVGGHPGEWEAEHPAEAAARLQASDVYLAGWYPHEDLPAFLAASDALVTTSERERFGLVLVEAMACGVPVLATRSPGPELIVKDGETGWLVATGDDSALVAALDHVIDDEAERRRRGEAARVAVREQFSWSSVAAALAGILAEVASAPRQAPAAQA